MRVLAAPNRCCSPWSAKWLAPDIELLWPLAMAPVSVDDCSQPATPAQAADTFEQCEREHCERILDYLNAHPDEFDLIHDESGSFFRHADRCPVPVLATLHLPRSFYREEWLRNSSHNVRLQLRLAIAGENLHRFAEPDGRGAERDRG